MWVLCMEVLQWPQELIPHGTVTEESQSAALQRVPLLIYPKVTGILPAHWMLLCLREFKRTMATSQVAHEPTPNTTGAGPTLASDQVFGLCIPVSREPDFPTLTLFQHGVRPCLGTPPCLHRANTSCKSLAPAAAWQQILEIKRAL